jgi:hypothetical protein
MDTAQNFSVKFSLTVTVEGASLQDIDNGLVQAAGERLAARMQNPPRLNGVDVLTRATMPPAGVTREEPRSAPFAGAGIFGAGSDSGVRGEDAGSAGANLAGSGVSPGAAVSSGHADAGGAESPAAGGKKPRGVKPGSTRGPYKKSAAEEAAESAAQSASPAAPSAGAPQAAAPATQAPVAAGGGQAAPVAQVVTPQAPAAQGATSPTLEQCVAALTKVNTAKNTDIAYKCLTDMGVKRCGEIPEARRAEFIAKCEAAAAGA